MNTRLRENEKKLIERRDKRIYSLKINSVKGHIDKFYLREHPETTWFSRRGGGGQKSPRENHVYLHKKNHVGGLGEKIHEIEPCGFWMLPKITSVKGHIDKFLPFIFQNLNFILGFDNILKVAHFASRKSLSLYIFEEIALGSLNAFWAAFQKRVKPAFWAAFF